MIKDSKTQDGFFELLQMQEYQDVPEFLESNIMTKIQPMYKKVRLPISLPSVFVLSSLVSVYILLSILSAYYYPHLGTLQDVKMMLLLTILAKLFYDVNDVLPNLFQQYSLFKKMNHR
jgi:hypothetical protein